MTDGDAVRREADELLADIARHASGLAMVGAEAEAEMAAVREKYAPAVQMYGTLLQAAEKRLRELTREQHAALLGEADRVDLPHGAVLFTVEKRVKRIKGMLARLKKHALPDCVKTAESVDWEAVERLPDDTLEALGTGWKDKENFAYEVREEE